MKRAILIAVTATLFAGLFSLPAHAAACTNDNFADATLINTLDHSDQCDSSAATTETGEPMTSCAVGKNVGKTTWWKYTPDGSSARPLHIKVNTYASPFNTLIALWRQDGSGFAGLTPVACNDQLGIHKTSRVTQALTIGKTYYIQAGGVSQAGGTLNLRVKPRIWHVGVVRGDDWYVNRGHDGLAEYHFVYGKSTDQFLAGDIIGHGVHTPWVRRGNLFILNDWFDSGFVKQFSYGNSTDKALVGDWNGDEVMTPVVRRGGTWYFNNGYDGSHELSIAYGNSSDVPLVGDWNGDGIWTPGVRRGNIFYLNNGFDGAHDIAAFAYGMTSDVVVVGDWNADGKMTPGVVRGSGWYLSNGFTGVQDIPSFAYGNSTDKKIVGDWNGIVESDGAG
ncbi:MAG TPA: hypothetical protein VJ922_06750 [Actinomycetota bacterium]|nr:hypothetical protein [Actinomycetota bacterium]